MILPYRDEDREAMKRITTEVFGPSAIDFYIEEKFGVVNGRDWKWRKARHIDDDVRANRAGIFVYEDALEPGGGAEILGYVTIVLDIEASIGRIPNLAVTARAQGRGIGRKLLDRALDYIRAEGMKLAKIETLVGNEVGMHLYPAMGFEEVSRQIHYVKKL
ncbi:GNAT family N-acetyltransferase [Candidatus Sumerlaeota bacterium]|nr:GNAT family N-acetyltransferase [Candidatus Sumerlaeota bacterium]